MIDQKQKYLGPIREGSTYVSPSLTHFKSYYFVNRLLSLITLFPFVKKSYDIALNMALWCIGMFVSSQWTPNLFKKLLGNALETIFLLDAMYDKWVLTMIVDRVISPIQVQFFVRYIVLRLLQPFMSNGSIKPQEKKTNVEEETSHSGNSNNNSHEIPTADPNSTDNDSSESISNTFHQITKPSEPSTVETRKLVSVDYKSHIGDDDTKPLYRQSIGTSNETSVLDDSSNTKN